MLAVRFHFFNTILWLLSFTKPATADPVCDYLTYGQPSYSDCRDLVLALYKGAPGQDDDRRLHFFSLRGEEAPPWIPLFARGLRTYLPIFVTRGQSTLEDHGSDLLTTALHLRADNCKMAITAIRLLNETITSDYARWHDVWLNAHSMLLDCVEFPVGTGGYHHVGTKGPYYHTLSSNLEAN